MRPFIVVDKLHIDVILGTDALKAFRAVVDLDENLVTLKDTVAEETTVLVEELVDLDASVRVARFLCTVHNKNVVVEVCNPPTEEMVIKKGTLIAAVSVVPESAFETTSVPSPAGESEPFSPERNASAKRELD
ncbi:hypothetical protein PR003_g11133 [Phytophthora rubi]|uniref:Uncharacterized protein n=1 Tax=Phytophthora rubi TaxID=129364 RepID=A0A6A3N0L3_9STRA|nr:hypothetical protein PR001_g8573 [Phytophthora rubi]KAE9339201.1 hypothetical protein PR003_g11133 [Phytophthora rubi]